MPREYGTVYGAVWVRPEGILRQLRGDAPSQVVALYLLTSGEMHMSGVARIRTSAIAEDTGLPFDVVRAALAELDARGFAFTDPDEGLVWVPAVPRDQFGACLSPRDARAKLITKYLDTVGPHPFVAAFREALQFPDERPPRTPPATPRPTPRGSSPVTPGSGSGSGSETKSGALSGAGAGAHGGGEREESLEGRREGGKTGTGEPLRVLDLDDLAAAQKQAETRWAETKETNGARGKAGSSKRPATGA